MKLKLKIFIHLTNLTTVKAIPCLIILIVKKTTRAFIGVLTIERNFTNLRIRLRTLWKSTNDKQLIIMETMICLKCFHLKTEIMLNLIILNAQRKEQIIFKKLTSVLSMNQLKITFFMLQFMVLCFKKQKKDLILIRLKKF